jgi:ribose transport system ATP-binding protein
VSGSDVSPGGSRVIAALRGVDKRFGNTVALHSVDLELRAGEVHVLLGENGAGKSTLGKVLAGIQTPDHGVVELDGQAVSDHSPRRARQLGIEAVHQETTVVPQMTVLDNVTLGSEEAFTRLGILDRKGMRTATTELLARLAPDIDPDGRVAQLPGSQRHLIAVAKALFRRPRVLIFDEATAALNKQERLLLFDVIRSVRTEGVAVLYITHHLDEVSRVGDRVTVMRDGAVVAECRPDVSEDQLVEHIVGRRVSVRRQVDEVGAVTGAPMLELRSVVVRGALRDVSFEARSGEILGVYGVGQCGVNELAEVLAGALRPDSGEVVVQGRSRSGSGVSSALRDGVAFLPGERGRAGIVPTLSVQENISLSNLHRLSRWGWLRPKVAQAYAERQATRMRVRGGSLRSAITTLSGGNQQKALLARALGCGTPVLVLKDPTVGVDVGSRAEIYEALRENVREGTSVVVLTADLAELLVLADRAVVLYRGTLAATLSGAALNEENVLEAALSARTSLHDEARP